MKFFIIRFEGGHKTKTMYICIKVQGDRHSTHAQWSILVLYTIRNYTITMWLPQKKIPSFYLNGFARHSAKCWCRRLVLQNIVSLHPKSCRGHDLRPPGDAKMDARASFLILEKHLRQDILFVETLNPWVHNIFLL